MGMSRVEAERRASVRGGLLWHYTSLGVLQKILESGCFLATDVEFQNDINETRTADSVFEEALRRFEGESAEAKRWVSGVRSYLAAFDGRFPEMETEGLVSGARFILCASEEPDLLYAWRTYGSKDEIGCAVGIDPTVGLRVRGGAETKVSGWQQAIYDPEELVSLAVDELRRVWDESAEYRPEAEQIGIDLSYIHIMINVEIVEMREMLRARGKDPSFRDEREHRVTVTDMQNASEVVITPSQMGPRPHLPLVPEEAGGERLPIRAIRLGPDAPQSAIKAVKWLLYANGYPIDRSYEPVEYVSEDANASIDDYQEDWSSTIMIDQSSLPYRNA